MIILLRHAPNLRGREKGSFLKRIDETFRWIWRRQIACWTFGQRKDWLRKGTDPIRLEYCLEQNNRMKFLKSIPGHSGRGIASIQNRKNIGQIPCGWMGYISHVVSSFDNWSIFEGGLVAGRNGESVRKAKLPSSQL